MGWETNFSVFEPKTGAEVYDLVKVHGSKFELKTDCKNDFFGKWSNEVWTLYKKCLLDGSLEVPGRKDGAVSPGIIHVFNRLLFERFSHYETEEIFDAYSIGQWAKSCWVVTSPFNENSETNPYWLNDTEVWPETYKSIGMDSLYLFLNFSPCIDLNNILELKEEEIKLFLDYQGVATIKIGLREFPEILLNFEGSEIVFTKQVMMTLTCAEKILQSKTEEFYFPFGSSNPEANEVLAELRKKQTLELSELKSLKEKMYNHFRERLDEENHYRVEVGDELSTIEELISYEGGDWIDEHRELAVGYIANDALDEVKNLGLSFMNEVDLTFVPQTKGELTLFDAIKYISNEDPASMLHFEANDFDIAHDYYWQLRKQMKLTGEFYGIEMSEYLNEDYGSGYFYNSTLDEKFLESAKAALDQEKLVYFWTA